MSEAWLAVQALRFRANGRDILDIPELALRHGEFIALSGRNGTGKTTLLKILAGLERPDRRTRFLLDGRARTWRRARRGLSGQVVYVHQQPYMFDASVFDNVAYGLRCRGEPRAARPARVRQALAAVGVEHLADRHARRLSGGERQRVAFARAWALQPRLLLLDEPHANLDREAREQCGFLIRRLHAAGIGMILTSHDAHWGRAADRHLLLADGRLTEQAAAVAAPAVSGIPAGARSGGPR